jgi:hypothetical protein
MLEKGNQTAAMIMVALLGGQRTGNGLGPAVGVNKARVRADFAQRAGDGVLIGDGGDAVRDRSFPVNFHKLIYENSP